MYEKHNWVNGEVITQEKLNHMEEGIFTGGSLVLTEDENGTLNHTWEEIRNAIMSGMRVGMVRNEEDYEGVQYSFDAVNFVFSYNDTSVYKVSMNYFGEGIDYTTDSPTGYPKRLSGGGGDDDQ